MPRIEAGALDSIDGASAVVTIEQSSTDAAAPPAHDDTTPRQATTATP